MRRSLTSKTKQQGMSSIGMLMVALAVVFVVLSVVKLFPVYLESMNVKKSIEGAFAEVTNTTSSLEIKKKIQRRFDVNRIESLHVKDIEIERKKGIFYIDATYEKRVPFVYNIDAVVKFDQYKFELTPGQEAE